jgi:hypothetical protein
MEEENWAEAENQLGCSHSQATSYLQGSARWSVVLVLMVSSASLTAITTDSEELVPYYFLHSVQSNELL